MSLLSQHIPDSNEEDIQMESTHQCLPCPTGADAEMEASLALFFLQMSTSIHWLLHVAQFGPGASFSGPA
jgi:hypothetical protein